MGTKKKPPRDPAREFLEWFRFELRVAAFVAGSITAVLLIRRWTTSLLGTGILNQELFAGGAMVNELVAKVETHLRQQEEEQRRAHKRQRRTRAQRAPDPVREGVGPNGNTQTDDE
jgi:hypothetical protein